MRYYLLIAILLPLMSLKAQMNANSDGFHFVTMNDDGTEFYVKTVKRDVMTLTNTVYNVEYWVKLKKPEKTIKDKSGKLRKVPGNIILQYYSGSCTDKEFILEQSHEYNSKGQVIKSNVYPPGIKSYAKAIPGSIGETLLNGVCGIVE